QDGAINAFATGYFRSLLTAHGKKRSKPSASFLFAGPPGTGKTFISETVAEALGRPFKRFEMSEYSDHQTGPSAFIGTPKGYTATRPGIVTGFVHDNPNAVILFDEIEKAHLNVIHLFLQILDAGRIRDNFTDEEIFEAVKTARAFDAKVYLTVNVMPHGYEYGFLREYLYSLTDAGIDGIIAADLGVIALIRDVLPQMEIHVSTQASIVSAEAAEQYRRLGCSRAVLARELTLDEIREIRRRTTGEMELEAFIHGSMCVSWSGRCLLSNHFTGRDANRGACAQPCRWNYNLYEIAEEKRRDEPLPIAETDRGTFIMSSRDLCMIEHIPALMESGIDSFKIEGRMKSAYYAAVTANTYRMAIDRYLADPVSYAFDPVWLTELESVSHREYGTGYFFDAWMVTQRPLRSPATSEKRPTSV
ncbi:MAG: U32 family peptidase, partial [Clostridia bacterium]|nr:U32 family peptidase [Clostridia bacterium]